MAKQVRDFVDGAPSADQFRRQAMAYQMGAGAAGKLDSTALQSRSHDSRYRSTGPERPNGRHSAKENLPAIDPGPGTENVIGKRFARLPHEWHNPIAPRLALSHENLGSTPPNILKLKRSQFLVANAGGGQQKQDRAVAQALLRRQVDRIDCPPDVFPREPRWQMGQPPARRSWNEPSKILIIEIGPAQKSQECHAYVGDQSLKTFAPRSRRAGLTLVVVNDDDLVVAPAECSGSMSFRRSSG